MGHTTALYEGTPGHRLRTAQLEVVGIAEDQLDHALQDALAQGAGRIELCGGMGAQQAARAHELVAGRAQLSLVRYGFESLEQIAAYKLAFAAGDVRPSVFLYSGGDGAETIEHPDVRIVPVRDLSQAQEVGAQLARDGVGLVELYGGLGVDVAAAVLRGAGNELPVGFADL